MREVNLYYFVPENEGELGQLVGKSVGVKISKINPAEPMTYKGICNCENGRKHEFLMQAIEIIGNTDNSMNKVWGFQQSGDTITFCREGILLGYYWPVKRYEPGLKDFNEAVELLKENGLWREPQMIVAN